MTIRPLAPLLVNQIAAGEVIERPASVVKELVENSIDAGAARIDVTIEAGGRELVRIADDGEGIAFDELVLAVAPHATSKISRAEDLDGIATMGFRGEALASIASVSRLTIVSRAADAAEAGRIDVEGGDASAPRPASGAPGTVLTVRNLFFNTPARRKFLRTDRTESSRVAEVVSALAIAHPAIGFGLTVDGRPRLNLPAAQTPRQRCLAVLGDELADELLEVDVPPDRASGAPGLWGLLGRPGIARPTARHLRLYLNGRSINDRTIAHAVREGYRGLIAPDRHPTAVVMLLLDPRQVDVNVHPAKAEVRFRDQSLVHRAVSRAVQSALAGHDLTPELQVPQRGGVEPKPFGAGSPRAGSGAGPAPSGGRAAPGGSGGGAAAPGGGYVYQELAAALGRTTSVMSDGSAALDDAPSAPVEETCSARGGALQIHRRYIVAEDAEGLVIVDQHALHERVMFERLRARVNDGPLESQRLLMPATLEIDERQIESLEALGPLLRRLGIEAEPIGPRAVAVHAFTTLLFERKVDPETFLRDLLSRADELEGAAVAAEGAGDTAAEAALHEVLDMMSCKAAIKAGDPLTPQEVAELLARRDDVERSSRCPHGRPTTLHLSIADLDRQFGR